MATEFENRVAELVAQWRAEDAEYDRVERRFALILKVYDLSFIGLLVLLLVRTS